MKFRTILDKAIEDNYQKWRRIAIGLAKDKTNGEDLLHEVIRSICENKGVPQLPEAINAYVERCLWLSWHSKTSQYARTYRTGIQFAECLDHEPEPVTCWWGREMNEQMDMVIGRLGEFDRKLFELYILPDFSYQSVSEATGIPVNYLKDRIHKASKRLRHYVQSSPIHPSREA